MKHSDIHMKLLLTFLSLFVFPYYLYPIYFKNIGVKEGLSQQAVLSIHQDKLGRIWFGTLEGISIYNGDQVVSMKGGDHLPEFPIRNNKIYKIVENKNNDIFIRADYSLIKYDFKQNKFLSIREDNITALSSVNGQIYVAAKDSIFEWNEDSNKLDFILKTSLEGTITKIFIDSKRCLWLGTTRGLFAKKEESTAMLCIIEGKNIYDIFESSTKELWIGTRMEGMYKVEKNGSITEFLHNPKDKNSISSNLVRAFVEDKKGNIWIGTFGGLNKYNSTNKEFEVYTQDNLSGSLLHSSVFSLLKDNQGTIWLGTYYGGVSYFNPERDMFTYRSYAPMRSDCINYPFIGNIVEDSSENVWICTEGRGLNLLDKKTGEYQYFTTNQSGIKHDNLKCIHYDSTHNKLYIGSYTGGLISYDITNKRFRNYLDEVPEIERKLYNIVVQVTSYGNEIIFLSTRGLYRMDPKSGQVKPLLSNNRQYGGFDFIIDSKHNLWLVGSENIMRINMIDDSDIEIFDNQYLGLGNFNALKINETKNGDIYFSTQGNGILKYDYNANIFTTYTAENNQLLSNYTYRITESEQGYLIITGDKGISVFDPSNEVVKHVITSKNLPISAFDTGNGLFVSKDGRIFAGGIDGLLIFYEDKLYITDSNHSLFFANLYVNNKKIEPNDDSKILNQILPFTTEVSLNHKQNNLALTFANNNYVGTSTSSPYEYMLEGFDKEWVSTGTTQLIYTNLNPGKYVLKVRGSNIYQRSPSKEIQLAIVIHPSLYNTSLAWIIYISLALTVIFILISFKQRQLKLKASLEYERKEKEYIKDLNILKLSFFTNVSHEFRTPLTLIITQIEMLLQNNALTKSAYEMIYRIYNNTFQMRNLINELLDFQKIDQKHFQLKVYKKDLISFVREIYQSFQEQAQLKHIRYNFSTNSGVIICHFDPEQLRKVFCNLLANAFKFTLQEGFIEIVIEEKEDIIIKIIDNGIGISKKDIDKIFEPFYQVSASTNYADQGLSTGIGLGLSKDVVKLHHGTISVQSKPNYGSVFIVRLKKGYEHFLNDPNAKIIDDPNSFTVQDSLSNIIFMDNLSDNKDMYLSKQNREKSTILIVEDNVELLQLLISIFQPLYNVVSATDGEDGYQKALRIKPDIILSDIMMPKMNGTEMCLKLKNSISTSHIPIVLLTAKTSTEHNIEGLLKGADDYIAKPFNVKVLLTRCNNLIRNRILLQATFKNQPDYNSQLLVNNELDQKFLKKAETIIDENIEDPEFDVNKLIKELAIGRSTAFVKFKDLTGMAPASFILNYKLKRAVYILRNNSDLQINEIAFKLGFNSSRNFSKCFKYQFNVSPTQYRDKFMPE